jgi:hypothetical protein
VDHRHAKQDSAQGEIGALGRKAAIKEEGGKMSDALARLQKSLAKNRA